MPNKTVPFEFIIPITMTNIIESLKVASQYTLSEVCMMDDARTCILYDVLPRTFMKTFYTVTLTYCGISFCIITTNRVLVALWPVVCLLHSDLFYISTDDHVRGTPHTWSTGNRIKLYVQCTHSLLQKINVVFMSPSTKKSRRGEHCDTNVMGTQNNNNSGSNKQVIHMSGPMYTDCWSQVLTSISNSSH